MKLFGRAYGNSLRLFELRPCIRSKWDSKIVKHKIATKIEDSYSINFVGSKEDSKIVKHRIATRIEGSYLNKNNTKNILYINCSKLQILNKHKITKSQILNIKDTKSQILNINDSKSQILKHKTTYSESFNINHSKPGLLESYGIAPFDVDFTFSCDFARIALNSGFYSQSGSVGVSEITKSWVFAIPIRI